MFTSVAAVLIALAAYGQAHPCDQSSTPTITLMAGAPHKVQFCSPVSDAPEAMLATIDGTPFDLVPVTAKSQPSATTQVLYESGYFLQVPKGNHVLTIALYNRNVFTGQLQLGAATGPFSFAADNDTPKAAAPRIIGIIKQ